MYYGKQWKINGVVAGPISPHVGKNGCYRVLFEREYAALEDIEGIDWSKVELVRLNAHDCDEGLPEGYGFELEDISYSHSSMTYTVTLRTGKQYLGDVTGYQAKIEALETAAAEQAAVIQTQQSDLAAKASTIQEQASTIEGQAATIQKLQEAGTAADLEAGLDAAYEEGVNSVE